MKKTILFTAKVLMLFSFLLGITACQHNRKNTGSDMGPSNVEIISVDGNYSFFVNGKAFDLKGVGMGAPRLADLVAAGGNSFRTWGANNADALLDSARKYNLMVAMGLRMGQELHEFDYNDSAAVAEQFNNNKLSVDRYKNHPNLLCWVVGNELNLKMDMSPVNPKVYDALKDIVDYIHETDPYHPVTTTFALFNKEQVEVALERCPDLDFLSYQVYGELDSLPRMVAESGIDRPYAVTEFGPKGFWNVPETEWGREIEEPSSIKAAGIAERMEKGLNDPLCLGGYAFIWGQKQERTPTWFGMFIKSGEATASVDEMTRYWTGTYPENRAPDVRSILLDGKKPIDNIYLKPSIVYKASVEASDPDNDSLCYQWIVLHEVIERSMGGAREIEPDKVDVDIITSTDGEISFISPSEKGEYRLFCYIFDGNGKVGTANAPFYVK